VNAGGGFSPQKASPREKCHTEALMYSFQLEDHNSIRGGDHFNRRNLKVQKGEHLLEKRRQSVFLGRTKPRNWNRHFTPGNKQTQLDSDEGRKTRAEASFNKR